MKFHWPTIKYFFLFVSIPLLFMTGLWYLLMQESEAPDWLINSLCGVCFLTILLFTWRESKNHINLLEIQKKVDNGFIQHVRPPKGLSNRYGHTCSQCGEFHTHEEIGTYKVLNPECPTCGWNTERDHHQRVQNQTS